MSKDFKIPDVPHYAIVTRVSTTFHESDGRGGVYPRTVEGLAYQSFLNREKWEDAIRVAYHNPDFVSAMYVVPAKVSTSVHVDIKV